jgi:endonuclease/exonuclease/phosphatase family metal-dependent hydrolase
VRADTPVALSYSNVQVHPFATQLVLPLPVGSVTFNRGWSSIDVTVKGQSFRFVTTHLDIEAFPPIQAAQAAELVQTAGNTHLPIIYAGDFNTPANDPSSPAFPTYEVMLGSGVQDVWPAANPFDPGLTCCQAQNDRNPVSQLSERSDLIFASDRFQIERALLVGERPRNRTASGLWPSDHAGVVAALCLDAGSLRRSCGIDPLADAQ